MVSTQPPRHDTSNAPNTSNASTALLASDQPEESARADLYALLAALFYAPPPQSLLDTIAATPVAAPEQDHGGLQHAWANLSSACKAAQADAVRDEYEYLFIGVGKPEVLLFSSYYLSGFMMEKPLVELRTDLEKLGLRRAESMPESEDHIAALFEVMSCLISSNPASTGRIDTQKEFFMKHIQPWAGEMCTLLAAHPASTLYASVADVAQAFFEVERQAFEMS